MVPDTTTADQPSRSAQLPPALRGAHAACRGYGCGVCLHTGLVAAEWVLYERDRESGAADRFTALGRDLKALFAGGVADLIRLHATQPGDTSAIERRVAELTGEYCWLMREAERRAERAEASYA